ncbi:type IV pilus assembly protein FimV [Burkholderia sp. LMU1-1-1.1]|uniref:type IV pilus assembly protein FimV n=1 Tax=Burkholderia sp. LMU1-1-1.1 TaxID=3135266 RepID=UPI003419BD8B
MLRSLACAVLLAPAGIVANAAELGDVSARSFIGQPLSADIELVALAPDEVNALQVRLARPDVFRGANITMNPALSSVRMSVVKRDQKQFLHVTTTRAIDAEYVHMYVELSAAGRQDVRLATVWLQADPNPPPPPAPVASSVPAPSVMTSADAERIAAQARAERAAAAPAAPAVRDRTRPAPLPSLHESETGVPGALKAAAAAATPVRQTPTVAVRDLPSRIAEAMGTPRSAPAAAPAPAPTSPPAPAPVPAKPAAKRDAAAADNAVPLPVAQALLPLGPLPLPAGVKRPAAPAACAPSGISAKECKALDTHSLALSSKLVELEGKMKALQGAIKNSAATPAAAPAAAPKVGQAGTAVLAAAGSSVAAAVAAPAVDKTAPKAASVASAAPGAGAGPEAASTKAAEDKPGKSSKPGKAGEAQAATMDGASASASAAAGSASASASADGHGANASASAAGASASASAPVPLKRVLPKLKYKKEKPVERPTNYVAWGAGAVGALLLAGAGLIYWRRKKSGAAPLKIWQGFRKKKPAEASGKPQEAQPLHEVTPESIMQ